MIHLWAAPEVVVTYLQTGDGSLRAAAYAAARARFNEMVNEEFGL